MLRRLRKARVPRHYQRLIGWALTVALGLLGLGLLTIYMLLRPERFTAFLQSRAQAAGLDLELAYPAIPTLLPHPAIKLQGLTLSAPGASQPILVADHGEVELPWVALFQRNAGISWLQLDAPRVDIDALQSWIRGLPADSFDHAPSLPRIDAGISIFHGSLVGHRQQPWLDDVSINAGALVPGHAFHLDMAGSLADEDSFSLRLDMVPAAGEHRVRLQQIQMLLDCGQHVHSQLRGNLDWQGGADLAIHLTGSIQRPGRPQAQLQMEMAPARSHQALSFDLHYMGSDGQADLQLPPDQLLQWWTLLKTDAFAPSLSLPQWRGHLRADQLDIGGARLEGLQIEADPSPAASAPARSGPSGAGP